MAQNSGMLMYLLFKIWADFVFHFCRKYTKVLQHLQFLHIFLNFKITALLTETMMLGAKIVLKDFQELGGIGKKHAFKNKLNK